MYALFDVKDVDVKAYYFNVFSVHVEDIIAAIIGLSINKHCLVDTIIQQGFF